MRSLRSNVIISIDVHVYMRIYEMRQKKWASRVWIRTLAKALKFRRGVRMRENAGRDRRECAKGGWGQLSGQQAAISRGQPWDYHAPHYNLQATL